MNDHSLETIKFGSSPYEVDELAYKVLKQEKVATSSLLDYYLIGKKKRSKIGDCFAILNSDDDEVAIVRIERINTFKFGDIGEEFAKAEGDESLDNWLMIHKQHYSKQLSEIGKELTSETLLVCEWFKVV